jgi:hypothetical protein
MQPEGDPHARRSDSLSDLTYSELVVELARLEARLVPPPEAVQSRTHLHLVTDEVVALHERHAELCEELDRRHGSWTTDA